MQCRRCGYAPKTKSCLKKHFQRKTLCKPELSDVTYEQMLEEMFGESEGDMFDVVKLYDLRKDITSQEEYENEVEKGMQAIGVTKEYLARNPEFRVLVTPELKIMLLRQR